MGPWSKRLSCTQLPDISISYTNVAVHSFTLRVKEDVHAYILDHVDYYINLSVHTSWGLSAACSITSVHERVTKPLQMTYVKYVAGLGI